jgi:hypothetical protein
MTQSAIARRFLDLNFNLRPSLAPSECYAAVEVALTAAAAAIAL